MANWVQVATTPTSSLYDSIVFEDRLYVSVGERLYRLNLAGDAMELVADSLVAGQYIYSLCVYNNRLYGGTGQLASGRLFRLNAAGNAWEQVCAQFGGENNTMSLIVYNNRLYGGMGASGLLYRLNAAGNAWEQVCAQLNGQNDIYSLAVFGGGLYGGTGPDGRLFRLNAAGNAWEQVCAELNGQGRILSLLVYNDRLYGGTHVNAGSSARLFRLNAAGNAWEQVCAQYNNAQNGLRDLIEYESRLYGCTGDDPGCGLLLRLDPDEDAWELVCDTYLSAINVTTLSEFGSRLYGGGYGGILLRLANILSSFFTATPTSGFTPTTVQFTNETMTDGDTPTYYWDFGDGESSTDENPEHTYNNAGQYTVSLTVTNSQGTDTATFENYINISGAGMSATPVRGEAPLTVKFTDTSTVF